MSFIERYAIPASVTLTKANGTRRFFSGSTDATRGAALVAAFAAADSGSQIVVGPGTFALSSSTLTTPANFSMRSAGRESTIITGTAVGILVIAGVGPCQLEGFSISSTTDTGIAASVTQAAMDVTCRDVAFLGRTDGLALTGTVMSGGGRFVHCRFYGSIGEGLIDGVGAYIDEITYTDCEFETAEPTGEAIALTCVGYKLRAYDCRFKARNAGTGVIGLKFTNTNDAGLLRGCTFDVAKTGGSPTVSDITVDGSGAVLTARNCNGSSANGGIVVVEANSGVLTDLKRRYQISLASDCRQQNGTALSTSDASGKFYIDADNWGDGTLILLSATAENTGSETGTLSFEFTLPPEYVAGEDVKLNISARYDYAVGVATAKTIDAEVYELSDDGTVSGDLNTIGVQTLTNAFADYPFTITDTNLVPGDRLRVLIRGATTAGAGPATYAWVEIASIEMQLDIKG